MALKTLAELLKESTSAYLSSLTSKNVSPTDVQNGIYTKMVEKISIENEGMPKGSKYTIPKNLAPAQIAEVLMYFYHIVKMPFAGLNADPQSDVIAMKDCTQPMKMLFTKPPYNITTPLQTTN